MISKEQKHFADQYIDEIQAETEDNYFTPVLEEAFEIMPEPASICDVGCGNGVFSAAIKQSATCRLVGVDGSSYALEQARTRGFDELQIIDDFSSSRLPFEDGSFDLVLNKDVLEHLLHPEHLVGEMARILRSGGHALIHVPNHFPLAGRFRLLFRNTIDPFDYFPDSNRWDFPHIRFFTMSALCDLFQQHGLEMVCDMSHYFFCAGRLNPLIPGTVKKRLCDRNPDAWTEGFTVLFRKVGA